MNTILLGNNKNDIEKAAEILRRGGLVAIPTETVYGLAADALNGKAVASIFRAKGRPMDNPLIVHISDVSDIEKFNLVREFPQNAQKLANSFWPGPLTMIMKKSDIIPDEVSAGLDTVAIRFPSHKTAQQIIKASNTVLAAPSANRSGSPSPTTAQHVVDDLSGRIDAVLDSGECSVGVESTVIALFDDVPRLLRPGMITLEQMEKIIGHIDVDPAVLNKLENNEKAASPGMKYKHYAPKAKVTLVRGSNNSFISFVNMHYENDKGVAAICYDEDKEYIKAPSVSIGKENDLKMQAHKLFDALRAIDQMENVSKVFTRCPTAKGIGMALYNRLIRAAAFEVINLE